MQDDINFNIEALHSWQLLKQFRCASYVYRGVSAEYFLNKTGHHLHDNTWPSLVHKTGHHLHDNTWPSLVLHIAHHLHH
jgi:hypothetical protein